MKSFAQNFEDVLLWRVFKDINNGFFIDIGAQHPVKDSVSKYFSTVGWHGIHVEPVSYYADMLRIDRPGDDVIQAIVSDDPGTIEFFVIEKTGLSTSRKDIADSHKDRGFQYTSTIVPSVTLDEVLSRCPDIEIHWMKIDVEGAEKSVLRSWVNCSKKPWIVLVEATIPGTQDLNYGEWETLIINKGYKYVYDDGLNRYYISSEHSDLEKCFVHPPNIFDGFQLSDQSDHVIDIVHQHRSELAASIVDAENQKNQMQIAFERQMENAQSEIQKQVDLASKRENAITQSAGRQKKFWLKRCNDLARRLQDVRANFAQEHLARLQSDQAIADERFEHRKIADTLLKQISAERFQAQERLDRLILQLANAHQELEAANQKADSLIQTLENQKSENASKISDINYYHEEICKILKNELVSTKQKLHDLEIAKNFTDESLKKYKWILDKLQFIFINLINDINRVLHSPRSGLFYTIKSAFSIPDITLKKISSVLRAAQASYVVIMTKNDDSEPTLPGDPLGNAGGIFLADSLVPATHQDDGKLNYIDIPFSHGKTIIDLMSLGLEQFVYTAYNILLCRNPDESELRIHGSALRSGLGRSRLLYEIYSSSEYEELHEGMVGKKSDAEYIGWLYDRFMRRAPDSGGLAHYTAMLTRGVKREQVKRDIVSSKEAKSIGSLWFELDRLIEAERQSHKRRRKWLRRHMPLDRQQHQQHEAVLQLFHRAGNSSQGSATPQTHSIQDGMSGLSAATGNLDHDSHDMAQSVDPLANIHTIDMPSEARRIIIRLQHARGASMEKGHA